MAHLLHKYHSSALFLGIGMLMLFSFCAPAYASDAPATPTFRSTSPFGINQTIQGATVNINGIHQGTIYKPFSSDHPYADLNPGSGSGGGSGNGNNDDDDDIGIPGWADTPSEPLPIGDSTPLFWLAATMIAMIAIRQRRKQKQLSTQTSNNHSNNDTNEMTLTQHTRKSFRKLLMLALLLCVVGEASGQTKTDTTLNKKQNAAAAATKTIYFRPSTVCIDGGYTYTGGSGSDIAWVRYGSSSRRYFIVEKPSNSSTPTYHAFTKTIEILPNGTTAAKATKSRFLSATLSTTSSFSCYRVYNLTTDEDNAKKIDITQARSNSTISGKVQNCIPNNEWWLGKGAYGQEWTSKLISVADMGDKNLVAIQEGYWAGGNESSSTKKGYYFGYYLENDAHIYFENKNDWSAPTFLRGKDIYAYSQAMTKIDSTNLYYCKLAAPTSDVESGIAYTDYAFISKATTKGYDVNNEDVLLWKRWPHATDNATDLAFSSKDNNSFDKLRKKSGYSYTGALSNKLSGTYNLFIPGSANDAIPTQVSLTDQRSLNQEHTFIVETGGKINMYVHALDYYTNIVSNSPRTDITGTRNENVVYTSTVWLSAHPENGYDFIGWYEKDNLGNLTRLSTASQYHYEVERTNRTIVAKFADKKKFRMQIFENKSNLNIYDKDDWTNSDLGGTITIQYTKTDGTTYTETIDDDKQHPKDDIHPEKTLTVTATPKEGYTFIGFWNNTSGVFYENPWTMTSPSNHDESVTARFAKTFTQKVNAYTYNTETDAFDNQGTNGGSVTITYPRIANTNAGCEQATATTTTTWTDNVVASGTSMTLTATAEEGYTFVGWYDGSTCVGTNASLEYAVESSKTINAYFAIGQTNRNFSVRTMIYNGSLTESLDGGTFTMTHSGGITYTHAKVGSQNILVSNAPVTFEATPNSDYEFIGWFNVDDEKRYPDNPWTIDDPTNTTKYKETITAIFASSKTYAKKQNINIEGPGTVEANYIFYNDGTSKTTTFHQSSSFVAWYNKQVTLTATPLAGYEFDGWYNENGSELSENSTYSYDATSAHTITAKFKSKVNKLTVSVLNYNTSYNEFREYEYEYNKVTLKQGSSVLKESYSSFSHEFNDATSVTLIATPESEEETGYDFVGWYQSDTLVSDNTTYTMEVIGMQAISARFAPKKCHKLTLVPNSGGTYTVHYGKDKNTYPNNFYSVESSLTDTVITYTPFYYYYTVSSAKPILGYKFKHHDASPLSTNENYWENFGTFHNNVQEKSHNVVVSFVREEDQVVYLDLNGQWDRINYDNYWVYAYDTTNILGVNDGQGNVRPGTYKWILMTEITANSLYTCTIPRNTYSHIKFVQLDTSDEPTNPISSYSGQNLNHTNFLTIPATRYNCYRINGVYSSDTGNGQPGYVDGWVAPPTQEGDYRLIYIEQKVASKTKIDTTYIFEDGDRIKKTTSGTIDTVSLHIYNKVSKDNNGNLTGTALNNPEIILQQWDGATWVDIERHMVFGPLQTDNTSNIRMPGRKNTVQLVVDKGIDAIKAEKDDATNDYGCGVWNFVIQQTIDNGNVTAKLLVNETHRYKGDYYIRTPNADGQYHNFTHPGNIMSYSEYAKNNHDYSHYFIRYVDINEDGTPTAEAGKHPVVKFCIANDYAINLCKEFTNTQNRFEPEEDIYVLNAGDLPADASVRFGWDIRTNRLTRAYIANTTIKNNEYLVVEGTNIGSPSGDATYFTDNSNWLYSIDLNATAEAAAKVKAKMNGKYQYFMGAEQSNETLISGNGASTYPIRLLYDFKDDRFTTIYRPEASLSGTVNLETPVMIEREHNFAPTQVKFNQGARINVTTQAFDQPAYAVMTFLESVLADASKTHHEKMFYWISFPFDVCIRDVFGLGDYGKYWIMEEYDGAQRAASGIAQNNWKYITKKSAILDANKGYVLCLNYSQILQDQLFKSYGGDNYTPNSGKLSLYFPSNGVISPADITGGQQRTVTLARYDNTTTGSNTAWNHHNWHIIGVPSFADPTLTDVQTDIPFLYQYWHPDDAYAAVAVGDESQLKFHAMHSYMVQYAGGITWNQVANTPAPLSLSAKTADEQADKKIMLRLELQQAGSTIDKTYVQLRNDKGTKGFDMSLDLTKIINAGANIYSIVDNHEMAGNAMPKEETVLPIGVVITAAGSYTFAMPQGTEGMIVELIDYEQGTSTNLLMSDYTITLDKGTFNQRFALRLVPDKVATSVDDITGGSNDDNVRKLLIDGVLYLQKGNNTYDAQGKHVQ